MQRHEKKIDMHSRKIIICDRDGNAAMKLAQKVKSELGTEDEVMCYQDLDKALSDMKKGKLFSSIIFMDINFGRNGGVETARKMVGMDEEIPIIFTGDSLEYVPEIFDVDLVKTDLPGETSGSPGEVQKEAPGAGGKEDCVV